MFSITVSQDSELLLEILTEKPNNISPYPEIEPRSTQQPRLRETNEAVLGVGGPEVESEGVVYTHHCDVYMPGHLYACCRIVHGESEQSAAMMRNPSESEPALRCSSESGRGQRRTVA